MPEGTTGYLFGIFDLFHIAHLDTVRLAAAGCDRLVVAVATDDLVEDICGACPFVPAIERVEIVGAIQVVAEVLALNSPDVVAEARRAGADVAFLPGDELDVVQLAALGARPALSSFRPEVMLGSGIRLEHLPAGRRTTSSRVRAALAGTTTRSSVA
jgi:glycerol-3-phosphate cytidylyltransferase